MIAASECPSSLFRRLAGQELRALTPALWLWLQELLNEAPGAVPLVGLAGAQGSGKSSLLAALTRQAAEDGIELVPLSLDDFYLGRRARLQLARTSHPLFATRGVPGTHDHALLDHVLATLAEPGEGWRDLRLPRFDKGRDTRLPPSRWRRLRRRPQLVVLEGWCVGTPPQSVEALRRPVNRLERDEDPTGTWRREVNRACAAYLESWRRLDRLVMLRALSWATIGRWRAEPERDLRARGAPRAMDDAALERFLMHYERLTRHALEQMPERVDLLVQLDAERRIVRIDQRR